MLRNLGALLALAATALAATHNIDVGEDGQNTFNPSELKAVAGDTLRFRFYSGSGPHDVVQGSLNNPGPCIPDGPPDTETPFYSGAIAGDREGRRTFTVQVNSSDPIYFYCSIARHCQGGMVGVVNPPPNGGYEVYKARASDVAAANRPFDGVQGGRLGTDGDNEVDDDNRSTSTRGTAIVHTTVTNAVGTTTQATTAPTNAAATTTNPTRSGTAAAGTAATTTPSGAGKNGETPVYLGLAVALGGLVALMA